MEIITDLTSRRPTPAVLTIGNFDGVHLGHQALLARVLGRARELGVAAVVMTFEPHTRAVVRPDAPLSLLTPLPEKLAQFARLGLDEAVVIPFNKEFAGWDARRFLGWVRETLPFTELWVGSDFALGHQRTGNVEVLAELGAELGYTLHPVTPVDLGGQVVSSTAVRQALAAGDVRRAAALLGRPFTLTGPVVAGARRGRELGFPTANVTPPPHQALPADGIYATPVYRPQTGTTHQGVTSIGTRPTFGPGERLVETYLLDFGGHLYGEPLTLSFLAHLRPQQTYTGTAALIEQMHRDVAQAREVMSDEW